MPSRHLRVRDWQECWGGVNAEIPPPLRTDYAERRARAVAPAAAGTELVVAGSAYSAEDSEEATSDT